MVKNALQDLLNADIPDPTDFPPRSVAPGLRELDSALRCKICSELYDAPVVLACGHCFCSLCTRTEILTKAECPTCRKETSEAQLRVNPYMEEVVSAWKDARDFVLRLSKEEETRLTRPSLPTKSKSSGSRSVKKRKRSPEDDDNSDIQLLDSAPVAGPSTPRRRGGGNSKLFPKAASSKDEDEEDDSGSDTEMQLRSSSVTEPPTEPEQVTCPVCAKPTPIDEINQHLDSGCKTPQPIRKSAPSSRSEQQQAWSKLFNGPAGGGRKGKDKVDGHPLPKASYAVLKDKALRELLGEYKLPVAGDRNTLIARHTRWVSIYNANIDRSPAHRKGIAELKLDLKRWEEERRSATKKSAVKDPAEHQRIHRSEFSQLVAQARESGKRKGVPEARRPASDHAENEEGTTGTSAAGGNEAKEVIDLDSSQEK
ncbi:hypothetical protein DENSPDRAFT_819534 [Dentipellis sp. KUC8613]|nr:hypothetical protein DENSPDRAFT_819534 [Dentipellis sp. KUC8613]